MKFQDFIDRKGFQLSCRMVKVFFIMGNLVSFQLGFFEELKIEDSQ